MFMMLCEGADPAPQQIHSFGDGSETGCYTFAVHSAGRCPTSIDAEWQPKHRQITAKASMNHSKNIHDSLAKPMFPILGCLTFDSCPQQNLGFAQLAIDVRSDTLVSDDGMHHF